MDIAQIHDTGQMFLEDSDGRIFCALFCKDGTKMKEGITSFPFGGGRMS